MREIKFRAWKNIGIKEMFKKVVAIDWQKSIIRVEYHGRIDSDNLESVVLMQYTGLKDENNVEIYEGDIVRYCGNLIGCVFFEEDCMIWGIHSIKNRYQDDLCNYKDYTVIGNIYENKELLEEQHEK